MEFLSFMLGVILIYFAIKRYRKFSPPNFSNLVSTSFAVFISVFFIDYFLKIIPTNMFFTIVTIIILILFAIYFIYFLIKKYLNRNKKSLIK